MYTINSKIFISSFIDVLNSLKGHSVLILTSPSISRLNGIQKVVEEIFVNSDCFLFIDDVIAENPFSYVSTVYERMNFCPEYIIGIGGGSVIDLAKAISVSSTIEELQEIFYHSKTLKKYSNVIAIPTTFGTGAETSYGAILYDDEKKIKNGLRGVEVQPNLVYLDFDLYNSASKRIKALAGFDCMTHCVETYVSLKSNDLIRYQAVKSLDTVFCNLEKAVEGDINAVKKMAIGSMMMGFNLAFSSTCMPHRLQYVIGPLTNTSHSEGLAALYKGWIQFISKNKTGPFSDLAKDLRMSTSELKNKIERLKKNLGIDYSLTDFGLNTNDIENILQKVSGNLSADPYYKDMDSVNEFIKLSL
ncbi:MAG: iron-containing alcohol dehydrogenase [Mediterranea sp.]|jgi:alcohol dehydrogenase class IV|nr:iron-containing alcohol dehydrogenase [Mediterranea sp.]